LGYKEDCGRGRRSGAAIGGTDSRGPRDHAPARARTNSRSSALNVRRSLQRPERAMLPHYRFTPTGVLILAALLVSAGSAAASPFRAMTGSWAGTGTLTTGAGTREQLRCHATYRVGNGGDDLQLNLRCASESYRFDLVGAFEHRAGAISGTWAETTRNAAGTLSGRAGGDRIEADATGGNFAAKLTLATQGNRQAVAIRARGGDVTAVEIALQRR
jgi:hypothetical protein